MHFARLTNKLLNDGKVHETITFLLVTLPNIYRFKKNFIDRLSNRLFLIWLLTTRFNYKFTKESSGEFFKIG